jgi:hypothetical protein
MMILQQKKINLIRNELKDVESIFENFVKKFNRDRSLENEKNNIDL